MRMTGVFPIAPTPFTDAGDVDLDGQRRVLDCMIDQEVDGICILANYWSSSCWRTASAMCCSTCALRM